VRAAAAARLAQGQLRALAWYGVPSVREVVLDSFERVRADFAALGFDYCHGLDAGRWLSTCAGLELVLRRYSEITQPVDRERTQRERFELGTSALLGLALAYRSGLVQPEFDLSTQLPLLGAAAGAPPLGVRASFSAAVQF